MTNRFDSNFDPDELAKITHRGLQSLSRSPFDDQRVTKEEVVNLKTRQKSEDTVLVHITRFFARIVDGFLSVFRSLLTPPKKKVFQCETYGHVLKPGWTGTRPLCEDCGAQILSLTDVRGATPKADRKDTAGQTPFQQQDRKYVK
jgi:hypothetical protein